VKQNRGHISVYSEPGRGTTFKIFLPPFDETTRPLLADPEEHGAELEGTGRVLVVEDDEHVRGFLVRVLEKRGYDVLAASRASEALRLHSLHADEILIVICDIVLPGPTGFELLADLRRAGARYPAIFLSGYTREMIGRIPELPAGTEILTKPLNGRQLARAVQRLSGRSVTGEDVRPLFRAPTNGPR
jgi:DNA-binding response OmpR family regulator